jgi:hypothetical protein
MSTRNKSGDWRLHFINWSNNKFAKLMLVGARGKRVHRWQKVPILTFSCNYRCEVAADGPNITLIISERKWRKSGGGRRCGHLCNSFVVLQMLTTCVHQNIDETYEPKREQIRDSWRIFLEDMGDHVWEKKNMVLNELQFEELIMGLSFLVDIDNVATISDAQGTLQRTHFSLPLPSSGIFRSHRFV